MDFTLTNQPMVRPRYTVLVNETPKFDLTSYISNYRGRTVFRRLYLIAACSTVLREEAARLAVAEAKRGNDIQNYQDAATLLRTASRGQDPEGEVDQAWVDRRQKQNQAETTRLEHELKGYKNNLIKESIRMGNEDLGSHYHSVGDLPAATKAYSRMRDFCTTPAHIASTAFRIIAVSIESSNWLAVQSQVHKVRNLQMKPDEAARNGPKTTAAMGLHLMCSSDYREAALSFLETDPSLGESYNEVMTSNDVAVYGGLCALASMSRSELQARVLENSTFRSFLELEPHIRRAISYFCASKYSQCLSILESYRADYLLDIYLQDHVQAIYQKVRTKSIVQYFQPFSRVTLESMDAMFGKKPLANGHSANGASEGSTGAQSIEGELIELIQSGTLDAKIDLEARVLVAKESDTRAEMHEEAIRTVDGFIKEARLRILRMNAVSAGLEVRQAPGKGKAGWGDDASVDGWLNEGSMLGSQGGYGGRGGNNVSSDMGQKVMGLINSSVGRGKGKMGGGA